MELTQQDYDTRKARVDKGEGDDEDARLVKQYEAAGFTAGGQADTAKPSENEAVETTPSFDNGPASTDDKGSARSRPSSRTGK